MPSANRPFYPPKEGAMLLVAEDSRSSSCRFRRDEKILGSDSGKIPCLRVARVWICARPLEVAGVPDSSQVRVCRNRFSTKSRSNAACCCLFLSCLNPLHLFEGSFNCVYGCVMVRFHLSLVRRSVSSPSNIRTINLQPKLQRLKDHDPRIPTSSRHVWNFKSPWEE